MQFRTRWLFEWMLVAALSFAPYSLAGKHGFLLQFLIVNSLVVLGVFLASAFATIYGKRVDGRLVLPTSTAIGFAVRMWIYCCIVNLGLWLAAAFWATGYRVAIAAGCL